ncbi:hypothetical protein HDF16_001802 [Granulicella aggregans]|uniref:Uncharacterized protein n=1 Tax=Granulicella aggregans TaxID=474949 RepID=A0A7W7ZC99_9BACT|nr:hypothetical protein [Granulicella aggregans]MBB5057117.1 hypothetical protein [Granulicella aggregans]
MPNQSGSLYGLTILSPIIDDESATPSHDLQIREYLANLPTDCKGPFALAPYTHLTRLAVMDDVIYVGMPSSEEHLKFKYLIWEANFDGDLDRYLVALAKTVPDQINAIWSHCVGYPGTANLDKFLTYMKSCQLETTFYFAAVNDKSLTQTLTALQTQRAVADFIAKHRGTPAPELQREFLKFSARLKAMPTPLPAAVSHPRGIKTGGRNE